MHPTPGTRIGPYEVVEKLGAGGMGDVYAARDLRLQRMVAIKICHEEFGARFEREARAVAALNHPNICTLHDIGPDYLVMELVEGETLAGVISQRSLKPLAASQIARQIARALAAAHHRHIIHRDLKPANIKITPDGVVKVLDFGLAKSLEVLPSDGATATAHAATAAGVVMGTVDYMSPEQSEGLPVDQRTDIWSLGIVLYQMVAGRTPFGRATAQRTMVDILHKPAPVPPGIPRRLAAIIDQCLQKDRAARYQSTDALVADLDACVAALERPPNAWLTALRRPRIAVLATIVLIGLGLSAGWWWRRSRNEQWARQVAIPEVHRLATAGEYLAAFTLAGQVERYLTGDRAVQDMWSEVSRPVSVQSAPPGAEVLWKPYDDAGAAWQTLGMTPVNGLGSRAHPVVDGAALRRGGASLRWAHTNARQAAGGERRQLPAAGQDSGPDGQRNVRFNPAAGNRPGADVPATRHRDSRQTPRGRRLRAQCDDARDTEHRYSGGARLVRQVFIETQPTPRLRVPSSR